MEVDHNDNPAQEELRLKRRLNSTFFNKICENITVEPIFFLHGMGSSIMNIVVQNFYIDRICRISENFENELCQNLTQNPFEEKMVESIASQFTMYKSLIENGLPILMGLFLGPFTDKYGNKSVLLLAVLGNLVSAALYILMLYFTEISPQYLLICSIPMGISGGNVTFVIASYGLLTKQSTEQNRSFRFALTSLTWDLGSLVGCLGGVKIIDIGRIRFLAVFIFNNVCYTFSLLYAIFFVREEKPDQLDLNGNRSNGCCSVFDISVIKEMVNICFKKRQGSRRRWIVILLVCISLNNLANNSISTCQYLFTRNKFIWTTENYSFYYAMNTLLGYAGGIFTMIIFIKVLKLNDLLVLAINTISNFSAYCLFALAFAGYQMYIGSVIQMFGTIATPVMRSILSKCVPKDEYGRLNSFATCVEFSMPFVGGSLYALVYMKTAIIFPGSVFVIAAGFIFVILCLLTFLKLSTRNSVNYASLEESE